MKRTIALSIALLVLPGCVLFQSRTDVIATNMAASYEKGREIAAGTFDGPYGELVARRAQLAVNNLAIGVNARTVAVEGFEIREALTTAGVDDEDAYSAQGAIWLLPAPVAAGVNEARWYLFQFLRGYSRGINEKFGGV